MSTSVSNRHFLVNEYVQNNGSLPEEQLVSPLAEIVSSNISSIGPDSSNLIAEYAICDSFHKVLYPEPYQEEVPNAKDLRDMFFQWLNLNNLCNSDSFDEFMETFKPEIEIAFLTDMVFLKYS